MLKELYTPLKTRPDRARTRATAGVLLDDSLVGLA